MKRLLAAAALTGALFAPTAVEAHSIRCASYVGNEACFRHAANHDWFHRLLANPLGVLFGAR